MAITTNEARQQIVDDLGVAVAHMSFSAACLGEAYDLLGTASADRLEEELFRPVQKALGRAKRARTGFAERSGLTARDAVIPSTGLPSQGVKVFLARAVESATLADHAIADLQDSMLPVEAGDAELRSGIAEAREQLVPVSINARQFLRTLGR